MEQPSVTIFINLQSAFRNGYNIRKLDVTIVLLKKCVIKAIHIILVESLKFPYANKASLGGIGTRGEGMYTPQYLIWPHTPSP